jgi:hypothetical protein
VWQPGKTELLIKRIAYCGKFAFNFTHMLYFRAKAILFFIMDVINKYDTSSNKYSKYSFSSDSSKDQSLEEDESFFLSFVKGGSLKVVVSKAALRPKENIKV